MITIYHKYQITLCYSLLACTFTFGTAYATRNTSKKQGPIEKKMGIKLRAAVRQIKTEGLPTALQTLMATQTRLAENGTDVVVIVRKTKGVDSKRVETLLINHGAKIMLSGKDSQKITLPLSAVEGVAALPEVRNIRTLLPPRKKVITSEGVAVTQASTWHGYGFSGAGAKVAVVDGGYKDLSTRQLQNEIPSNAIEVNFSSSPNMTDTDPHGSACAEIIYDMAPDVQLYLIKIDDVTDLIAVKDYCIAQGIDIISCSLGWDMLNFHDGIAYNNWYTDIADHPVTAVNQANAAGIFCTFAAGNEQQQYTLISWGSSGDDLLWSSSGDDLNVLYDDDGDTTIPTGKTLYIGMSWNQWPVTSNDFDIYLYKKNGSSWDIVEGSEDPQTGESDSYPMEEFVYTTTSAGEYAVGVSRYQNSSAPTIILRYYGTPYPYYWGYDNYAIPAPGSIAIPGDAASCFTAGALEHSSYTSGPIEYYSSLGPNNRGYTGGSAVIKPDICAPAGVETRSYSEPFYGTSASTPHVAGLAALIKGVYTAYAASEIKQYIEENGFDLGPAGKDNTYGSGAALLPAQLAATVTLSNLTHDYDGTAKAASATTTPTGIAVDLTYNGSVSAPIILGSYTVTGTINESPFYGSDTNTLTIMIDPQVESDALEISVLTTTTSSVTLQFNGIPGGSYNIMTRPSLNTGTWQSIDSITLDGNGTASFTDNNPPASSRFYMLQN